MKKILFLSAILSVSLIFAQKNLIRNGGFELDSDSWRGENILTINPYTKKTGDKGGSIYEYTSPYWKGIDQEFNIPKNTPAIEVSAWVKADGIQKGKNDWNKGSIVLELSGKPQNIVELDGTTNWQFVKKVIPIEKERSARLMIVLFDCTGSFFFDDIKIIPLTKEEYNKIEDNEAKDTANSLISNKNNENRTSDVFRNGNFENGTNFWQGAIKLSNNIKKEGNSALVISSNAKDWTASDQTFNVPTEAKSVTITGWLKSDNIIQGENTWNNGLLNIEFTSDGKTKTANDENIGIISGTNDWQQYSKTFKIPNNTKQLRLIIALCFATGTLFADDIQVSFDK